MLINKFIDYLNFEKRYSQHTIKNYRKDIEEFQSFFESEESSDDLLQANKKHLRFYVMGLVDSGLSERTINRKISALKSFYKYLLKIEELEVSPASPIKTLKHKNKIQLPFSESELDELILQESLFEENFSGIRDRLILELLYQTGIRRAELISLKVKNIDFENKNIKVTGKRNKERIIPLSEGLANLINKYLELRQKEGFGTKIELILKNDGEAMYEKFVYNKVNYYLSKISTKQKKSPHILRHSFATHILNQGAELNAVKELLGHSSLAATQVYTHSSIKQLQKVFAQTHPRELKK